MKNPLKRLFGSSASAGEIPAPDADFLGLGDQYTDVEIMHAPGMTVYTSTPRDFEKFRILVDDVCGSHKDEQGRRVVEGAESKLGFKFPGGMPVLEGYCKGFEFEDRPNITLPKAWTFEESGRADSLNIHDENGRLRGRYEMPAHTAKDRQFLYFYPRFTFDTDIVASTPQTILHEEKMGDRTMTVYGGRHHYWMPSIKTWQEDVIPCFIYAHPAFWPLGDHDFSRVNKEMDAVRKAEQFIAHHTKEIFPGASIRAGTDQAIISDGRESMTMGIDIPGDVFAHWDEPDVEERLAKLRAILESEVPNILGADNSLILATFPTPELIAEIKENAPEYSAPPPKTWQKPLFWLERQFNREP